MRILELLAGGPMRPSALREAVGIKSAIHFSRYYLTPLMEKGNRSGQSEVAQVGVQAGMSYYINDTISISSGTPRQAWLNYHDERSMNHKQAEM